MAYSYLTALYSVGLDKAREVFEGAPLNSQQDLDVLAARLAETCGPHMRTKPKTTTCLAVAFALYLTLNGKTFQ